MVKNTLNVGSISVGFVLDHIEAGKSMDIYKYLHLDKLDCCVAIIKNAKSSKMGKKDIIKIECPIDFMDLDILGFIDHNITVNIIENEQIVEKKQLRLPQEIKNVIRCKNPRCITSIEQGLDHVFVLTDEETRSTDVSTAKRNTAEEDNEKKILKQGPSLTDQNRQHVRLGTLPVLCSIRFILSTLRRSCRSAVLYPPSRGTDP